MHEPTSGEPYALRAGEGWTYSFGPEWIVKAGERGRGRRLAFTVFTTRAGEEPQEHTHPTEDEIFYVLQGDVTFQCEGTSFDMTDGGFVFLPRRRPHAYKIRSDGDVRMNGRRRECYADCVRQPHSAERGVHYQARGRRQC